MKTFFFFIALIFTSLAYSQGNLQFNQVLTYNGQLSTNYPITSNVGIYSHGSNNYTVPLGKVWKIEYLYLSSGGVFINSNVSSNTGTTFTLNNPIWLKANDIIKLGHTSTSSFFISIIEFNIVP